MNLTAATARNSIMQLRTGLAEGQVLQRLGNKGGFVHLAGICPETGKVRATIREGRRVLKGWKDAVVGQSLHGRFRARLTGIPAGGPYRLDLRCREQKFSVRSFYVGDVWVMAGQSNMEGLGAMTGAAPPHPLIWAFSMRREWRRATDPLHIVSESPDICHYAGLHGEGLQCSSERGEELRDTARIGVGVGIFFGREMLKRSGVPQGLICAAHSGTSMAQWNSALKKLKGASLYASMIHSVKATGQSVAGILWHQGEHDAQRRNASLYTDRMKTLIASTRRDLKQPALPWLLVQIARDFSPTRDSVPWNFIQEQQRLLPDKIKNLETVSAIDLPLEDHIHLASSAYPRLAARLARAANRLVYGNKREKRPPQLKAITTYFRDADGDLGFVVDVSFDHIAGGLQACGEPCGFTITDAHSRDSFYIYKTTLHGDIARLHLIAKPGNELKVSYGHGIAPYCNITDEEDCALAVFGPTPLFKPKAYLPFVTTWKVSDVTSSPKSLSHIACPDLNALRATIKTYGSDGFIDEHLVWNGKSGHAYFACLIGLSESMKLELLMDFDGPFRVWVDKKPFFSDLNGTNPCLADQSSKIIDMSSGSHEITVGMDLNNGLAWGFFLRFSRPDVSLRQINARNYTKPSYFV